MRYSRRAFRIAPETVKVGDQSSKVVKKKFLTDVYVLHAQYEKVEID